MREPFVKTHRLFIGPHPFYPMRSLLTGKKYQIPQGYWIPKDSRKFRSLEDAVKATPEEHYKARLALMLRVEMPCLLVWDDAKQANLEEAQKAFEAADSMDEYVKQMVALKEQGKLQQEILASSKIVVRQ